MDNWDIEEVHAIVELKDYGFKLWAVLGDFHGLEDGFVLTDEYGDRKVVFEDEVAFTPGMDGNYKFFAHTSAMQAALERGFKEWKGSK